jgi:hypothetical protein
MIEIKCTQQEKENIIDELADLDAKCIFDIGFCRHENCRDCLDERIKWTIRGNEDAE